MKKVEIIAGVCLVGAVVAGVIAYAVKKMKKVDDFLDKDIFCRNTGKSDGFEDEGDDFTYGEDDFEDENIFFRNLGKSDGFEDEGDDFTYGEDDFEDKDIFCRNLGKSDDFVD